MQLLENRIRILVVEDSDAKYLQLETLIRGVFHDALCCERAATITEAEVAIAADQWSAIILDISMNITKSAAGPKLGGHATLGGLGVATKMFLLGREMPTIIVTAFDTFQDTKAERGGYEVLGLEDIEHRARETLGAAFVGCVRYGVSGWETRLILLLKGIVA